MAAVDDYLTCAICLEWLKSPRRLPCHHVYCLECLRGLAEKGTDQITCPECRRDHVMPNNRVDGFPVDGRLEQLIEKLVKPKPKSDDNKKDCSANNKCEHGQPACRECRTNRALVLESVLQESRQFRADFLTENQIVARQNLKTQLLGHKENLRTLRMKVITEMKDAVKECEKREETLLSIIQEKENLIVDSLSKLEQADDICAKFESQTAGLVDKVPANETLVSLRDQFFKQKKLMTTLQNVGQNAGVLDAQFNREELRKVIVSYGGFSDPLDQDVFKDTLRYLFKLVWDFIVQVAYVQAVLFVLGFVIEIIWLEFIGNTRRR